MCGPELQRDRYRWYLEQEEQLWLDMYNDDDLSD
jgi:hypothetical protein